MRKIILVTLIALGLSGCFYEAYLNNASKELSDLISLETEKSILPIKEISIISLSKKTNFSVETHNGLTIDLENIESSDIPWWVYFQCDSNNKCELFIDDSTSQTAKKADFKKLANTYVAELVSRINRHYENTKS